MLQYIVQRLQLHNQSTKWGSKELGHMSAQYSEIELTLVEIYIATLDYGSDTYVRSKWQL